MGGTVRLLQDPNQPTSFRPAYHPNGPRTPKELEKIFLAAGAYMSDVDKILLEQVRHIE